MIQVGSLFLCCHMHRKGSDQPLLRRVPTPRTLDAPCQDTWQDLRAAHAPREPLALITQVRIGEMDHTQSTPKGVIIDVAFGRMVGGKPDLELRSIGKLVAVLKSCRDWVVAGDVLDHSLIERAVAPALGS